LSNGAPQCAANPGEVYAAPLVYCCTTPAPAPETNGVRFGVPGTNTLKYNALCQKINDLASDACITADTYKVVSAMIDEVKKVVAAMKIARSTAKMRMSNH
jgi:hypothetical protein